MIITAVSHFNNMRVNQYQSKTFTPQKRSLFPRQAGKPASERLLLEIQKTSNGLDLTSVCECP